MKPRFGQGKILDRTLCHTTNGCQTRGSHSGPAEPGPMLCTQPHPHPTLLHHPPPLSSSPWGLAWLRRVHIIPVPPPTLGHPRCAAQVTRSRVRRFCPCPSEPTIWGRHQGGHGAIGGGTSYPHPLFPEACRPRRFPGTGNLRGGLRVVWREPSSASSTPGTPLAPRTETPSEGRLSPAQDIIPKSGAQG